MRLVRPLIGAAAAALLVACAGRARPAADRVTASEGYLAVPGGRIWYARMGDGPGVPLIVIHGGPGSGSFGLKPWAALGDDRPVVRYDQLGAGKADHPTDTALFTTERAVRELQALRDALGLREVHLYGRSWGAMVVQAYMATRPTGVRSVVLSSPLVTTAQWERDADSLLATLPDSMRAAIATHEAAGTTTAPAYAAAVAEYYARYVTRHPRRSPADADSGSRTFGALVYGYMWGPSEFRATGTLKRFDGTASLRALRVPTLFVTGEHDEATPASTARFATLVPGSEFVVVPDAAHSTENDNPAFLLRTVRDFLRRADGGATAPARRD
jgi:proline iminopeptidase